MVTVSAAATPPQSTVKVPVVLSQVLLVPKAKSRDAGETPRSKESAPTQNLGVLPCVYNPSFGKTETGRHLELTGSLELTVGELYVRKRSVSKQKVRRPEGWL